MSIICTHLWVIKRPVSSSDTTIVATVLRSRPLDSRGALQGMGQVETDEIYVGVDRRGAHYVFPIQAKGGRDRQNIVQIEQDFAVCAAKFPNLICRAIGAQLMGENLIALFEFEESETGIVLASEKHYRLVPPEELSAEDLIAYRERLPSG